MSRRGVAGGVILVLWLAGLGVLAQRELFRPHLERLAEAAIRVGPTTTYLSIHRGTVGAGPEKATPVPVGYASSVVDTTPNEIDSMPNHITIVDFLISDAPGTTVRSSSRTIIRLTRTLKLRSFESSVSARSVTIMSSGTMLGDTAIVLKVGGGATPAQTRTIRLDEQVILPQLLPIALALTAKPEVGRTYTFAVFDPSLAQTRRVTSSVKAETVFVIPDSSVFDSVGFRWTAAHVDTVHAWRVASSAGGFNGWLDEIGRVVATSLLDASAQRTSYEIAFENWQIASGRQGVNVGPRFRAPAPPPSTTKKRP